MTAETLQLELPDAAATERAGAALAGALEGGMIVTLQGDLGAGKTTLARGVLRGLGYAGPVKSPSYTLVEHYPLSSLYLYHFDFYRFADPSEWEWSGFSEHFRNDSACLIEWPERVAPWLPPADVALALAPQATGRSLTAVAHTLKGERCLNAIATAMAHG
jgi:tRNA threonylcarbamoyladenosine biosynthesis protein TsaE